MHESSLARQILSAILERAAREHASSVRSVCTSGNLSDEPMCTSDDDALERLRGITDQFLLHDRLIVRPADDSVARVGPKGLTLLRRARGYAPLPLRLAEQTPVVLALGAQLKSTVALAIRGQVVVSQHLGDLHSAEARRLLARTAENLLRFYGVWPEVIACDEHPDYASTHLAEHLSASYGVPLVLVQHHHAHVAACIAEHGLTRAVLGLAWDGSGYGSDHPIWGGEFLIREGHRAPPRSPAPVLAPGRADEHGPAVRRRRGDRRPGHAQPLRGGNRDGSGVRGGGGGHGGPVSVRPASA